MKQPKVMKKILEAKYFGQQMRSVQEHPEHFTYNLSAFLSAARSAMVYMRDDANRVASGRQWYDTWLRESETLRVVRDRRDESIHEAPVEPRQAVSAAITERVGYRESVIFSVSSSDGKLISTSSFETDSVPSDGPNIIIDHRYSFDDGSGDVTALVSLCISALERMFDDGVAKGFLSGPDRE